MTFTDNGDGTATLAGTPAPGTDGTYPLTIGAANGVLPDASQSFTLTVDATAPAITSAPSATFTVGGCGQLHGHQQRCTDAHPQRAGALPGGVTFVDQRRRHGHPGRHAGPGHGWHATR